MKDVVLKYECPICSRQYNTKEEAESCFVSVHERFKVGDIVNLGLASGRPIKITHLDPQFHAAITGEFIAEFDMARGVKPKTGIDARGCFIGTCICHAEKYDLNDAKDTVKKLKKRLAAAEKFLEMVKAMEVQP